MSTSSIGSSLLASILGSTAKENKFATNLNQLAKDLKSGSLSAAKADYLTLTSDMQNGATAASAPTTDSGITTRELSNIAGNSSKASSFLSELNKLGSDLNKDDLTSSLQDFLALNSTAANVPTAASAGTSSVHSAALIRAIVQAMAAGNTQAAGYGLAQLASLSGNSSASSYLKSMADSLNYSSSSTVSQLLNSLNNSGSPSYGILSLLA